MKGASGHIVGLLRLVAVSTLTAQRGQNGDVSSFSEVGGPVGW